MSSDKIHHIKQAIEGLAKLDVSLARAWLEDEIKEAQSSWGTPIPLKALAYLLYKNGDVADAPLIWRAKVSNFDCFASLDIEWVAGAGPEETIAYLEKQDLQALPVEHFTGREQTIITYLKVCIEYEDFFRRDPGYIEGVEDEIREMLEEAEPG